MTSTLIELFQSMLIAIAMVMITVLIHYEILGWASKKVLEVCHWHGRVKILFIISACFMAHILEVGAYAFSFYLMHGVFNMGGFAGEAVQGIGILEYIYFSMVSYTSLGIGDIYSTGVLRLVSSVEALIGLLMIAWSASLTYISMERFWSLSKK